LDAGDVIRGVVAVGAGAVGRDDAGGGAERAVAAGGGDEDRGARFAVTGLGAVVVEGGHGDDETRIGEAVVIDVVVEGTAIARGPGVDVAETAAAAGDGGLHSSAGERSRGGEVHAVVEGPPAGVVDVDHLAHVGQGGRVGGVVEGAAADGNDLGIEGGADHAEAVVAARRGGAGDGGAVILAGAGAGVIIVADEVPAVD